jgi:hypothetical protein
MLMEISSWSNVSGNQNLVISYVGFNTETIKIKNRKAITVSLSPANASLDEVVVVGYGAAEKQSLNYSAAPVTVALQGQGAGLYGSRSANIKMRGVSSFSTTNTYAWEMDTIQNLEEEKIQILMLITRSSTLKATM